MINLHSTSIFLLLVAWASHGAFGSSLPSSSSSLSSSSTAHRALDTEYIAGYETRSPVMNHVSKILLDILLRCLLCIRQESCVTEFERDMRHSDFDSPHNFMDFVDVCHFVRWAVFLLFEKNQHHYNHETKLWDHSSRPFWIWICKKF
jgi:hypothetical protein